MLIGPNCYRLSGFGRLMEECITPYSLRVLTSPGKEKQRVEIESWFVDFITDFITYIKRFCTELSTFFMTIQFCMPSELSLTIEFV